MNRAMCVSAANGRVLSGAAAIAPALVLVAVVGAVASEQSGQLPLIVLGGPPDHVFNSEFIQLTKVVELSDGRVIALHFGDNRLLMLDPRTGTSTPISRVGSGPGEYRLANALFALRGDTAAVRDGSGTGQLLLIHPDGKAGRGITANPGFGCTPSQVNMRQLVSAADTSGMFYSQAEPFDLRVRTRIEMVDSAAIIRWNGACRQDTVAHMPSDQKSRRTTNIGLRAFTARANWVVAPDGRVAIVHPSPFRIELYSRSKDKLTGPVIPFVPDRVTEAVKDKVRELAREPQRIEVSYADGRTGVRTVRVPWREPESWPDVLPPFMGENAAQFAPDGRLWIRQYQLGDDEPVRYWVVDRRGEFVQRVQLPPRSTIVGLGRLYIYVMRRDADDIERLERHRYEPQGSSTATAAESFQKTRRR
jgi:hypothetical protein